ncbi:MAG: archease [Syntrophales bacterium]|nr:archease [Syntrophales bacterium]MDP3098486.1 archease [Syntrophales bacterium]
MGYRIFDHTADLGVEVTGATLEELYAGAAFALFDLLTDLSSVRAGVAREIIVSGEDPADLLVNFLREILYAWNGDRFLMKSCLIREVKPQRLKAVLRGETFDPARHRIKQEVKAVTYHQASVEKKGDVWVARVIFDV